MHETILITPFSKVNLILDPTGWYARNQGRISIFDFMNQYTLVVDWLASINLKVDNLDKIWEHYPFSKPTPAAELPELVIDAGKMFCFVGDPPLAPIAEITFDGKGKKEALLIYPYDQIAYMVDGVLVNSGRMN